MFGEEKGNRAKNSFRVCNVTQKTGLGVPLKLEAWVARGWHEFTGEMLEMAVVKERDSRGQQPMCA